MKRFLTPLLAAIAVLGLSSCFQSETVVHVNKDGSGTITEETTFGAQMSSMIGSLGGESAGAKDPLADMTSEDEAKKKAMEKAKVLGEGVTFEKAEKVDAGGRKGMRVTYKFADINKVRLSPGAVADDMKSATPAAGGEEPKKNKQPVTFALKDDKLTIKFPEPKKAEKPDGEKDKKTEEDPLRKIQQEAMMKQMFADMKISLKVVADGGIASSDASYTEGNTVTLVEMDFSKLIQNPEMFKMLEKLDPGTPEAEAFKGVEGIKMETKREVTIGLK